MRDRVFNHEFCRPDCYAPVLKVHPPYAGSKWQVRLHGRSGLLLTSSRCSDEEVSSLLELLLAAGATITRASQQKNATLQRTKVISRPARPSALNCPLYAFTGPGNIMSQVKYVILECELAIGLGKPGRALLGPTCYRSSETKTCPEPCWRRSTLDDRLSWPRTSASVTTGCQATCIKSSDVTSSATHGDGDKSCI